MSLTSTIYSNDERIGTITLDEDGTFTTEPQGDVDLLRMLDEPVFVDIDGELTDVYSDKDPILFMEHLAYHYKSQGLRATPLDDTEDVDWDEDQD